MSADPTSTMLRRAVASALRARGDELSFGMARQLEDGQPEQDIGLTGLPIADVYRAMLIFQEIAEEVRSA